MTEPGGEPPPSICIGTAERNEALKALDAHLEAGRLDAMEYGERSAHVAEARTAAEIEPLFTDLPAPHPRLPGVADATASERPVATASSGAPAVRERGALEVWGPRVAAAMPFIAVALAFLVGFEHGGWAFFLLIPAAGALFRGSHGHRQDEARDRRDEHRAIRDEHRAIRDEHRDERRRLRDERHGY